MFTFLNNVLAKVSELVEPRKRLLYPEDYLAFRGPSMPGRWGRYYDLSLFAHYRREHRASLYLCITEAARRRMLCLVAETSEGVNIGVKMNAPQERILRELHSHYQSRLHRNTVVCDMQLLTLTHDGHELITSDVLRDWDADSLNLWRKHMRGLIVYCVTNLHCWCESEEPRRTGLI